MTAPGPATLKVGVHIRIGDSNLVNAIKKQDRRYPLGYGASTRRLLLPWLSLLHMTSNLADACLLHSILQPSSRFTLLRTAAFASGLID